MGQKKGLRRDARDNVLRLEAAAREVFLARGLDAPLDEIARAAGVSIGTLYNRFGSRESLIEAVVPDVVAGRLEALRERVDAAPTVREALERFLAGMIDLQVSDPALNDAILRRFPRATALTGVCEASNELGRTLVRLAHEEKVLAQEFTGEDLIALVWLAGRASHDPAAPPGWRRMLERSMHDAWL